MTKLPKPDAPGHKGTNLERPSASFKEQKSRLDLLHGKVDLFSKRIYFTLYLSALKFIYPLSPVPEMIAYRSKYPELLPGQPQSPYSQPFCSPEFYTKWIVKY
ncbi:hypothetical protein [Anditalea andensis]|uniref:Uncharacterized protein n=1 Tax=Anditalea andensis TaxID=1048983 RepID=A0A074L5X1_9BACT|nr:hypothetical protein [Anditalea andensis]KEO75900.1 hypothetical protein EL17_23080 [Anditalea andensis]